MMTRLTGWSGARLTADTMVGYDGGMTNLLQFGANCRMN